MPSIIKLGDDNQCTGSIIANDLILTAAHCMEGGSSSENTTIGFRNSATGETIWRNIDGLAVDSGYSETEAYVVSGITRSCI